MLYALWPLHLRLARNMKNMKNMKNTRTMRMPWALSVVLSVLLCCALCPLGRAQVRDHGHCEQIDVTMCKEMGWNATQFPNLMGNGNQEDAGEDIGQYTILLKTGKCKGDFYIFVCALYFPVCTIMKDPLPPCRGLCESARAECTNVLKAFGYEWPKDFDCDRFPVSGPEDLCVGNSNHTLSSGRGRSSHSGSQWIRTSTEVPAAGPSDISRGMNFECPVQLQVPKDREYQLRIGRDHVVRDCGAPCYHNITFFDAEQIRFARNWIGGWSAVCLVSCLFTLATYLIDRGRFPYPERPIIYLSLCFAAISIIFLVGYANGDDIACNPASVNRSLNFIAEKTIRQGLHNTGCTLTAMALYFFLVAGSIWWVMLTVTWFLSAGLKWGQESIDVKSQWFHTIAWAVPAILTSIMVILKKIEGDVLSGVCFLGLWDSSSLLYFIAIPLSACLILGTIILVLGFSSLVRIRTIMKSDGSKTDKLERLMLRIGVFSFLYTVPAVILVCCYFYEQSHLADWTQKWQEDICRTPSFRDKWQTPCKFPDGKGPRVADPNFHVFLAKYFVILMIGVISGFWVWCGKTINTWNVFFARIFGRNRPEAYV